MSNDWWSRKMGVPATPQATPQQYVQQPQAPVQPQQQPQNYPVVQQTMPLTERCPGCGSGNYGGATPESRKRCYDCGYPIQQSGSGLGNGISGQGGTGGPAQPSKQLNTGNNFNPQTIIGHI